MASLKISVSRSGGLLEIARYCPSRRLFENEYTIMQSKAVHQTLPLERFI